MTKGNWEPRYYRADGVQDSTCELCGALHKNHYTPGDRCGANLFGKEQQPERVIYRRWRDTGTVIAYFPDQYEDNGLIGSYEHVGQHGLASYPNARTKPADVSEPDVQALARELASIGYRLFPIRRLT